MLALVAAVLLTKYVFPSSSARGAPWEWMVGVPVLTVAILYGRGLYRESLRIHILEDLRTVVSSTAVATLLVVALRLLVSDHASVASEVIPLWVLSTATVAIGRTVLFWNETHARRAGRSLRPTLIVGAGAIGRLTARRLIEQPELGLRPVGFLDKDPLPSDDDDVPVLGASWDLERVIAAHNVDHVIVTFSTAPHTVMLGVIKRCQELGISVSLVPRLFEKVTERFSVEHLGGLPLISVQPTDPKGWQFAVKYAADRALAAVAILIAAPFMIVAAIAIRLSMGRPIFYRQLRMGRDDRVFEIMKFRSMRPASELPGDQAISPYDAEGDSRVTRLGAFLRRTSIDELPQLFNILSGDMSFVGPRPERPEFVDVFRDNVYRYQERHRVKSGITGWAQVHGIGRGENRFGDTILRDRVEWDNYYIENWSLWFDVKILLMTVLAVLRFRQSD